MQALKKTTHFGSALCKRGVHTSVSYDNAQARRRVLALYRNSIKKAPWVQQVFCLPLPSKDIAHRVRQDFEKHKGVKDPAVIDFLILKGVLELEEVVNMHKQRQHMIRWLDIEEGSKKPRPVDVKYEEPSLQQFFKTGEAYVATPLPGDRKSA